MANTKDFVVDGFVNVGGSIEQKTGSVSSSVSTEDAANISEAEILNLTVSGMNKNGISFSSDGTYIYTTSTAEIVYQYALSTAWDLTTIASSETYSLDVSSVVGSLNGLCLNSDGTKMYLIDGTSADILYQYTLSTAYNLSTATYDNKSFYFGASATYVYGSPSLHNNDQTLLLPEFVSGEKMCVYTLSTPGDITTATLTSSRRFTELTNTYAATFNSDGTKIYARAGSPSNILEFNLATPYSVAAAPTSVFTGPSQSHAPRDFFVKPDDTLLFDDKGYTLKFTYDQTNLDADLSTGQVFTLPLNKRTSVSLSNPPPTGVQNFEINLDTSASTSYDFGNISLVASSVSGTLGSQSSSIYIRDSSRFYTLASNSTGIIYTYDMTDFDASTAISGGTALNMADSGDYEYKGGLFFKPDGSKLFIMGSGYRRLSEFSLSTPWDISSHTYLTYYTYRPLNSIPPTGFFFKPDGTRFYINYTNRVYQFDTSTAWSTDSNITTESGNCVFSGNKYGLVFNDDGTKMFVSETPSVKRLEEYTLSTPWDVSTASLTATLSGLSATGLSAADDGNRLFLLFSTKAYEHSFGVTVSATYPSNITWQSGEPSLDTNYTSYAVTSDGGTTYLLK